MDAFKLAPREDDERTQFAQDNLLDPAALPPPAWKGLMAQPQRLLRPAAKAGRTLTLAGAPFAQAVDQVGEVFDDASDVLGTLRNPGWHPSGDTPRTAAQDWYFRNVVDDIGGDAVKYWTPDAASTGTAANMVGTAFEVLGSVPEMVATPGLFLADAGLSPAIETIEQGGDTGTALKVGAVQLAANAVGFKLPAALGATLPTRIASGVGLNLAVGVPADAATQAILADSGMTEQSKAYDPFSVEGRALDVLMGAAFGWRAHLTSPPVTPSQRAAILTANNAYHADAETLPGQPRDATAAAQHRSAMQTALQQILRDQRVNVALDAAGFELRPELVQGERSYASADAIDGYGDFLVALESGGDPNARAPTSSATGLHQFTRDTWLRTIKRVRPDLTGMDEAELLALRTDPNVSAQMERELRAVNAAALEKAGQPVTRENLYAAHHFGEGRGVEFARADDATPMREILTEAQIKANPYLADLTKAQTIDVWNQRARRAGIYSEAEMDAPNFGLPEAPRPLPDDSPLLAETAQIDTAERMALRESLIEESFSGIEPPKLEEGQRPVAYVMGGGGASGKGTILKNLIARGDVPSEGVVHIDPDEIKGRIPEYRELRDVQRDSRAAAVVHEESSQIARDVLRRAIDGKYDLVLDRTLGDKAKGLKELQALKDAGYEIRLAGVTVDPRTAVARAVKRAQGSGRFVPIDQLLKAHKGFADAFEDYAKLADQAQLFDNTGAKPVQIASKDAGGELAISESSGYNQFRQRSQINEQASTLRGIQAAPGSSGVEPQPAGGRNAGAVGQGNQGEGSRGAGRGVEVPGRSSPEEVARAGDAAIVDEVAAQFPDMLVPDDDGNLRPIADYLAAVRESQLADDQLLAGIEAATNCAIGYEA